MFGDHQAAGIQQWGVSQKREYLFVFMRSSVGRVQENDVERGGIGDLFGGQFLQATKGVDRKHTRTGTNFQQIQILAN